MLVYIMPKNSPHFAQPPTRSPPPLFGWSTLEPWLKDAHRYKEEHRISQRSWLLALWR